MDLCKITLLVSLLLAILQVKGISWNKHFTHMGDLGFRALHSMIPGMQLNQRTTVPVLKQLSESQEAVVEDILPELDHLLPYSGEWSSKTVHKPSKRSPEVGVNHTDDQTILNWTKGQDHIVDTYHEVVRGLNDEQDNSDISTTHQILIDVISGTNTLGNINQIIEKESTLDDRYLSNNSTKLDESDPRLINIHEGDENVMFVQSGTESTMSITYDNGNITFDNSSLENASADILIKIETTEYTHITVKSDFNKETDNTSDDSVTNERNRVPNKNPVTELVNSEDSVAENYRTSERRSTTVPAVGMRRSLPGDNKGPTGPKGQEVCDKIKNAQRKIALRNQCRQQLNPAALRKSRYHLVTSRDKFQPKYFVPEMSQVRSGSNLGSGSKGTSFPFGAQRFSGIPDPNLYIPQQYHAWLNQFGSIPASSLYHKQDLFSRYLAKPPQRLSGYGQSGPNYINAMANDPKFRIQTVLPSGRDSSEAYSTGLATSTNGALSGRNRWFLDP